MGGSKLIGRLLVDPPLGGATNMARDAALLAHRHCPSLRFYRWTKPTLSLGYFQTAKDLPIASIKGRGGEVVRRSTGGKAILHEHELTYSLCSPESGNLSGGPAKEMEVIHNSLLEYLGELSGGTTRLGGNNNLASDVANSAWCFEDSSPLDIALENRKLLGSAARRKDGWVLFHGSLVISPPQETPQIASTKIEPKIERLRACFEEALEIEFANGEWLTEELELSKQFELERYGNDDFTFRQ